MGAELLASPTDLEALEADFTRRFSSHGHCPYLGQLKPVLKSSYERYSGVETEYDCESYPSLVDLREKTLSRIETSVSLPPIPSVVGKLDKVLESPDVSAAAVADVVSLDPMLVAKTLKLVNSGVSSLRREIDRIDQAVALLGTQRIRNLTLAVSVVGSFDDQSAKSFEQRRFWEHSLAVASASSLIGRVLKDCGNDDLDPEKLFLAGLMHDIGRVILAQQLKTEHEEICELARGENGVYQLDAELAITGVRHTSLGKQLLTEWNMAPEIIAAAEHHHEPDGQGLYPTVVHCADAIAHGLGFYTYEDTMPRIDPKAWADAGLSNLSTQSIGTNLLRQMESLRELVKE